MPKQKQPAYVISRHFPSDLLKAKVRQVVETKVKAIRTGTEAKKVVLKKGWKKYWQVKSLDIHGRVLKLSFHGVEVALFYKRDTVEYRSEVTDPTPYAKITDPEDAWLRVEMMHSKPSAKRDTYFQKLKREHKEQVIHTKAINRTLMKQVDLLQEQLVKYEKTIERLRRQISEPKKKRRRR